MVRYADRRGSPLALAHQTVCRHGQILRSGFPDPKARFTVNEEQHVSTHHSDRESYICGPQCAEDRVRAKAAEVALEELRQSCAECEPREPREPEPPGRPTEAP
jgi:hypothetical protein